MNRAIISAALCFLSGPSHAAIIAGNYPICTTRQEITDFSQAKIFGDVEKMSTMVNDGSCTFVAPNAWATVLDPGAFPKVLVTIPHKPPITGYTVNDNFKGKTLVDN
jgi:hypothetical protein